MMNLTHKSSSPEEIRGLAVRQRSVAAQTSETLTEAFIASPDISVPEVLVRLEGASLTFFQGSLCFCHVD